MIHHPVSAAPYGTTHYAVATLRAAWYALLDAGARSLTRGMTPK